MKVEAIRPPTPPLKAVGITLEPFEAQELKAVLDGVYDRMGRDVGTSTVYWCGVSRATLGGWARQLGEVLS